jgi:hypothetical protein
MGHDEALANQYDFNKTAWKGSKGQQAKHPKNRGRNLMMSGLVSRVFLWDPKTLPAQLEEINRSRQGTKYFDEESAIEVNGTPNKSDLTNADSPFLKFVEVGASNGGDWWNGVDMHLQTEDLANCMKVMYPGKVPILFTDWSQGHARK